MRPPRLNKSTRARCTIVLKRTTRSAAVTVGRRLLFVFVLNPTAS